MVDSEPFRSQTTCDLRLKRWDADAEWPVLVPPKVLGVLKLFSGDGEFFLRCAPGLRLGRGDLPVGGGQGASPQGTEGLGKGEHDPPRFPAPRRVVDVLRASKFDRQIPLKHKLQSLHDRLVNTQTPRP